MSPRNTRRAHWPWRHTLTHAISSTRQQRGTVLLMVVGVLALLAIIGVVYATIGRADRSAATTTLRQQRIADQSEEIAAYIAKVIGDATFAQYVERTEATNPTTGVAWTSRTRGYTYPWTDEHFLSVNPSNYAVANSGSYSQNLPALPDNPLWYTKFSPTGDNPDPWQPNQRNNAAALTTSDPRNHADPYLATIEPEWLRLNAPSANSPDGPLYNIRDWRHISNLSPSGNFVNLANLRKSNNGGFDAPPGFRIGSATNLAQMSYGLTLRNRTSLAGDMIPHTQAQILPNGLTANPANPAHWSNNQIFAYQPAIESKYAPDEYENVLNQWCDTDGDGFLDARWFELTDLSQMFGVGASVPRQLITTRGRVRLFCAARVVDNSAKINVNVASDMLTEGCWPTANFQSTLPSGTGQTRYLTRDNARPAGLTPADIALNRVLRLSDMNLQLTQINNASTQPLLLGYAGIPNSGTTAYDSVTSNYSSYNGIIGIANTATPATASNLVGNAAYSALLDARKLGTSPVLDRQLVQSQQSASTTAGERFDHYDIFAADPHSARVSTLYGGRNAVGAVPGLRVLRSPYDLSDELELSTFWGVNDSSTLSRLEATVGGRSDASSGQYRKFSPLRDNRSRALETVGRDEIGAGDFFTVANRDKLLAAYTDVRHLLTTVNGSVPLKDGGVAPDPTRFTSASTDISAALKAIREFGEIAPGTAPTAAQITARTQAIQLIFKLYANALAPYTDTQEFPSAWDATPASSPARRGLVYGGNSELALRVAAHMTANLVDAFDRDRPLDAATLRPSVQANGRERNEQTRLALKLVQVPGTTIPGGFRTDRMYPSLQLPTPASNQTVQVSHNAGFPNSPANAAPISSTPSRLPLQPAALPSRVSYPSQVGMMTIFGTEAQPFLTEYGVLLMYTDTPDGVGSGDNDTADSTTNPTQNITIKMKPKLDNDDFICEVLCFQLHNPFNQDVVLYDPSPAGNVDKQKFYLELAGRYYSFRQQDADMVQYGANNAVVLGAGKTRTFYTLNPGTLKAVGERIKKVNDGSSSADQLDPLMYSTVDQFRDLAKDWIEHQLQRIGQGITDTPLQLTQTEPINFGVILPTGGAGGADPDMNLWGDPSPQLANTVNLTTDPGRSTAERRVCNLWRTVRTDASLTTSQDDAGTPNKNDVTNDILADRMHDPSNPASAADGYIYAERSQSSTNDEVRDALGDEPHNTGYTATVWAAIRRPTDVNTVPGAKGGTKDSAGRPYRGVLPPWCLEARMDSEWTNTTTGDKFGLNRRFNGSPNDQGSDSDYSSTSTSGRFKKLRQALLSDLPVNTDIAIACPRKGGGDPTRSNPIGKTKESVASYQREYSEVAVEFHDVGEDLFGGAEDTGRNGGVPPLASAPAIRRSRNPALFSRSADFLLPLAVGAWFDPSRTGSDLTATTVSQNARDWATSANLGSTAADREASWMTLSEALALACGYYSPQDPRDPFFEFGIYSDLTPPSPLYNPTHPPKADRGHLVLNAFTPYLLKTGGVAQPLGSGVPFALSIIDQFRAAIGVSSTPKLVGTVSIPQEQTRSVSYGGGSTDIATEQSRAMLTRREGNGNINTQNLTVMRSVPMLTPEDDNTSFFQTATNYYSAGGGVKLFDATANKDYDIAPTLKAYRDMCREDYLERFGVEARSIDFTPTSLADLVSRWRKTQYGDPQYVDLFRRESRGFKSLGELAAVNIPWKTLPSTIQDPVLDPNSIFRFGERDQRTQQAAPYYSILNLPTGTLGNARTAQRISFQPNLLSSRSYNLDLNGVPDATAPIVHGNSTAKYYALGGNELRNGYQEKLAIVNALTNTVSVRSDVFTVYFVIHGYTPDDCDVESTQSLVPSVAKRYVMIVDRSNVVAGADKPRILMLKEVPMQ